MYRNWGREKREETCTAKFEEGGELEDGRECIEGWRGKHDNGTEKL